MRVGRAKRRRRRRVSKTGISRKKKDHYRRLPGVYTIGRGREEVDNGSHNQKRRVLKRAKERERELGGEAIYFLRQFCNRKFQAKRRLGDPFRGN